MEAFRGRGQGDYFASHDLEDFVAVIDGRTSILQEVQEAPPELRDFIGEAVRTLLTASRFHGALPGHALRLLSRRLQILSNHDPLDIVEVHLVPPLVVELGRPGAGVVGHGCGPLQSAAILEISRDAGGAKAVIADLGLNLCCQRPPPNHRIGETRGDEPDCLHQDRRISKRALKSTLT